MKNIFTTAILLWSILLNAQLPTITIAENTIKVGGASEEVFYYGLAEGDKLLFNFEELKGKELKEIEIVEMPGVSRFMDFKSKKIENKTLQITHTGIYKFRFSNSSLAGRICKFKLERIPASEATVNFRTSVLWKTISDTLEKKVQEPYLVKRQHKVIPVVSPENYYINSGTNALILNGSSRVIIPIKLPPNTVEWYYTFSSNREESDKNAVKNNLKLASQITKVIDATGITSLVVDQLLAPPGGDFCDVYLLDAYNIGPFNQKNVFHYIVEGSRENIKQGTIKITNKELPFYYIGIKNPSNLYGIDVSLEVVAIVLEEEWGNKETIKLEIKQQKVPYLNTSN